MRCHLKSSFKDDDLVLKQLGATKIIKEEKYIGLFLKSKKEIVQLNRQDEFSKIHQVKRLFIPLNTLFIVESKIKKKN